MGDDPACVTENRRRLAHAAGYIAGELVAAQQIHGTHVAWVGATERGRGAFCWEGALPDTDGLLLSASGIPMAIQVADCAPVLIVDPARHVLALLHAGWRGALGGIASQAVQPDDRGAGVEPANCWWASGRHCARSAWKSAMKSARRRREIFGANVVLGGMAKPHLDLAAMLTADLGRRACPPRGSPGIRSARAATPIASSPIADNTDKPDAWPWWPGGKGTSSCAFATHGYPTCRYVFPHTPTFRQLPSLADVYLAEIWNNSNG